MHSQDINPPSLGQPKATSIVVAAVLATTLSLACSTASAQGTAPNAKNQVSVLLGFGSLNTDLAFGTTDDIQPISLSYGFNFKERQGILVQLTPSTDLEDSPGFEYKSTYILYKAMFSTGKENIKPYAVVGLSDLSLSYSIVVGRSVFTADDSGIGLALGGGVDYIVSPTVSLRLFYLVDAVREVGDLDISTASLNFGVSFRF